jgi:hypothetical protein
MVNTLTPELLLAVLKPTISATEVKAHEKAVHTLGAYLHHLDGFL